MTAESDDVKHHKKALGRLTSFGLTRAWQVSLLLPAGWEDMTSPVQDFGRLQIPHDKDQSVTSLLLGRLSSPPEFTFTNGKARLSGTLVDLSGNEIRFSKFGDTKQFESILKKAGDHPVYLYGRLSRFGRHVWMSDPDLIHPWWAGRLRPRYPGKTGVIGPDLVRHRVLSLLRDNSPLAAEWIKEELSEFGDEAQLCAMTACPDMSIKDIILQAHIPVSVQAGHCAQQSMETFAALGIMKQARQQQPTARSAVSVGPWQDRTAGLPFQLTDEQRTNIDDICREVQSSTPLHGLLSGDVGYGKTAVYGVAAASVADGGGRVAVLLPSETLAEQIFTQDLSAWFPDLKISLLAGDHVTGDPETSQIVVGTTALLHRLGDDTHFDLVVVDEQQRFSREQRESLLKGDSSNLLEVSATPIPRTGALIRYGIVQVWHLTKAFKEKNLASRIWYSFEKKDLFQQIRWSLAPEQGHQVLVIYPLREDLSQSDTEDPPASTSDNGAPRLPSVMEAFDSWNKIFPGQVRALHGAMSSDEKQSIMDDMLNKRAQILLATTVVEVGINLPQLRRVVVMHPERFGLSQLHQIRGRAARLGGSGYFDLFIARDNLKEETMERLRILEQTQDGFKIAEADMRLRGFGNLAKSSDKQTGADDTFLFGRGVSLSVLDRVMKKACPTQTTATDQPKPKTRPGSTAELPPVTPPRKIGLANVPTQPHPHGHDNQRMPQQGENIAGATPSTPNTQTSTAARSSSSRASLLSNATTSQVESFMPAPVNQKPPIRF